MDASRREAVAGTLAPALAAGLALPAALHAGIAGLLGVAFAASFAAMRIRLDGPLGLACATVVLVLGVLASLSHLHALAQDPLASQLDHVVHGRAVVTGTVAIGQWDRRAIARFDGSDVLLRVSAPIETGEIIELDGHLRAPRGPTAGGFDERTWLARQGVHEVLRARSIEVLGRRAGAWGAIDAVRRSARAALHLSGGNGEAVADGVVLGGDDGLSSETRDAFRASGLGHLLAVSGQNVVLLIGAVVLVCGWLGASRAPALGLAIGATILYVLVVGPGASVVRAGITGVVVALAWLANRPVARWHVLSVAAAGCLWLDPWAVLEPGFQLSFAAVVAIFTAAPHLRTWLEGTSCPARLREPLAVSTACTLVTAPIA
ncbi:MAG: competence protein ComEC, partial [Gaiellales bacterium]|nr:competence protein ComEC [Gaiellales bacterium]